MNGIILRLQEGTKLSQLPAELISTLRDLLPDFVVEEYSARPNYQQSFQRRADSLYDAFLFILKSYPPHESFPSHIDPGPITVDTLKAFALACKKECDMSSKSVDTMQESLVKFTAQLANALAIVWHYSEDENSTEEAIACLNEAEQYVLMGKGRPSLATLIPTKIHGQTHYILQYDKSLPPHTPSLIADLNKIKELKYPLPPKWFQKLPTYQQLYLFFSENNEDVRKDLFDFINSYEVIKNRATDWFSDLKSICDDSPLLPNWFNDLKPAVKEMVRELSLHPKAFDYNLHEFNEDIERLIEKPSFDRFMEKLPAISLWYWLLPRCQQYFLAETLVNSPSVEDAVSYISSRHRTIPAPANYAEHNLFLINRKGEITLGKDNRRIRSSHVASRDGIEKWPKLVQKQHCEENFEKVTEFAKPQQLSLMQTLISPLPIVDSMPSIVTHYLPDLPDLELYKLAKVVVKHNEKSKNLFLHNHPYNLAKLYYYTASNDPDSLKFISQIKESKFASIPEVQALLTDYINVLESPLGTATFWDYDGRELFLSSLEQLLILSIKGFSYGSCVSGKDRKAIELIHTDAMMIYKEKYGTWPQFGWPKELIERIRFVDVVVDLYTSRHQHEHAGQNAPGSEGIKTPDTYFPNDIADAINKRIGHDNALKHDDRLATNNEVKKITKNLASKFLPENRLFCKLVALQLGEQNCTTLYSALLPLINQNKQFYKANDVLNWPFFGKGKSPKGIVAIRNVFHTEESGQSNVERMGEIFYEVIQRPEVNDTRTEATKSVYGRIRALLKPLPINKTYISMIDDTVREWTGMFNDSKSDRIALTS